MKLFDNIANAFESFDTTVNTYLTKTLGAAGINYSSSNIFGAIINGMRGVMHNVMFYLEDAMQEQNIFTASRKKSLYSLAKLSGYDPYYGSAATGIVDITSSVNNNDLEVNSNKIFIRNHSVLIDENTGVTYVMMLPVEDYVIDLAKPLIKYQVKIVQGIWVSTNYVGIGKNFESIDVKTTGLYDRQYMSVTVNGVKYEQAPSIYDMTEGSEEYVVTCGFDGTFEIMFGNDLHGKALQNGDSVVVEYIIHNGDEGNILQSSDASMVMSTSCYNIAGNIVDGNRYLSFDVKTSISGGTNADTIDLIRRTVGYTSRSLVIASEDNFKQFLKRFSFIGQCYIYTEPSSLSVTACCINKSFNNYKTTDDYLNIEVEDMMLTDDQKNLVIDSIMMSNKTFGGVTFSFIDPIVDRYAAICYVKVQNVYNKETTSENIKNAIIQYFVNIKEGTTFISKSDIINIVTASDENIIAFDIDFVSETAENAYKNGYYIQYTQQLINGTYKYVPVKRIWENTIMPGLDSYGNIQLASAYEIPLLHGGFSYYADKSIPRSQAKDSIKIEPVQIIYIN